MEYAPVVAVFGSSQAQPGDPSYELAVGVGRSLAATGFGVTNGGYGGVMEAVSRGAASEGGRVIGVTAPALFPDRRGANPFLTETIESTSLTERIHLMSELAAAAIVLPGSIGTLTELTVVWNDASIAPLRDKSPRPIVATRDPWEATVRHLESAMAMARGLITFGDSASDLVAETRQRLAES